MVTYGTQIENAIYKIVSNLKSNNYNFSKRMMAILLLQRDEEVVEFVRKKEPKSFAKINDIIEGIKENGGEDPLFAIQKAYQKETSKVIDKSVSYDEKKSRNIYTILSNISINPLTGIPLLILVLYFGFYKFVGVFGAGILVDYIQSVFFDGFINPKVNEFINSVIPWKVICDLIANDYGIITLGAKYAIAIILPVVGCFFLVFSVIEDSGYLPRVSFLLDRVFKGIGLNGRAVIPMTLGFGCGTMATLVSRTLETKRERVLATFLLALTIPCSAQLGIILALLSGNPLALFIWVVFMIVLFLLVGFLTSRVLPGKCPEFYMEIPPIRMPKLGNIIKKTYTRMYWYFKEVLPLFIFASVLIWIGNITGILGILTDLIKPVVLALGLPEKMSEVFLFGFFRRDYGAAGLFDMQTAGAMTARQMVVAAATLTLFVPCVAQFAMMIKERGIAVASGMAAFIFTFAFLAGFVLNKVLMLWGVLA